MQKYKLTNGTTSIDFPNLEAVAQFKLANPIWADVEPVAYNEEPQPEIVQVPESVTLWQLRAALALQGKEQQVTDAIMGMPEPNKTIAYRAWEYSNNVFKSDPVTKGIQVILQLSDAEVDAIFLLAESL